MRPGRRHARAALLFLPNFALAKAVIYLLPLGIAALAPASVYGGVELAQSVGLLVAALSVGVPMSGMTQAYLIHGERRVADQIALVLLAGCATSLLLALAAYALGFDPLTFVIVASLGAAVLHYVGAAAFRMLSRRDITAWADGTAMLISGAIVLVLLVFPELLTLWGLAIGYLAVAVVATLAALVWLVRAREAELMERLATCLKVGLPMTIVSALAIWLGVGGRIVVGVFNAEALAAYGVAFRVAGLTLGIHQLAITAMFARLYAARTRDADKMFTAFFVAVALLSAVVAIAGRELPNFVEISALDAAGVASFRSILPLAALQTFYWIGYAMTQMRINRSRLAQRAIKPTIIVTAAGIAVIVGIATLVSADVVLLSWLIALHSAAYFFANSYVLAKRGLPHRRIMRTGIIGGALLALIAAGLG